MKFLSGLVLVLVVSSTVSAANDKKKEGKDKTYKNDKMNSEDKSNDKDGKQPSMLSRVIGSFKTVIDILKTGDASGLTQAACDRLIGGLGILNSMDCICQGTLVDGFHEIRGDVECGATSETCLTDTDEFCGGVILDATLVGGLGVPLSGDVSACLAATVPHDLGDVSVCISAESLPETAGVGFDSCTAILNDMPCTCTPCEGTDFAVKFDCSAVDVSPFPGIPIYGPNVDSCKLLSFQSV